MNIFISEREIRELIVWRVLDWMDEPNESNLESVRDAAHTLALLRLAPLRNDHSKEQLQLLLMIQGMRAELLGAIATLEIAACTPQLPDEQAKSMAQTMEHAIEVFIQLAEGV